ncbi:MAG: ankyrin repeat domain-containing protein [Planctomycetia bacterium]|nr:ankyrin repeat domain-containing protein [Planctomycetia bacterium]
MNKLDCYYVGKMARLCQKAKKHPKKRFDKGKCLAFMLGDVATAVRYCEDFVDSFSEEDRLKFNAIKKEMETAFPSALCELSPDFKDQVFRVGYAHEKKPCAFMRCFCLWIVVLAILTIWMCPFSSFSDACREMTKQDKVWAVEILMNLGLDRSHFFETSYGNIRSPGMYSLYKKYGFVHDAQLLMQHLNEKAYFVAFLEAGGDPNLFLDDTPLFFHLTDREVVDTFLQSPKFDLNAKDSEGKNVLFYVSSADLYEYYLEKGADDKCVTSTNMGLLEYHFVGGSAPQDLLVAIVQVAQLDIPASDGYPLVCLFLNDRTLLPYFLEKGVLPPVFTKDHEFTLLNCYDGECMKLLLDAGIDINAKNDDGNTPLHLVSSESTIRALIQNGAGFMNENNEGLTPLEYQLRDASALTDRIAEILESSSSPQLSSLPLDRLESYVDLINTYVDLDCNVLDVFRRMIANRQNVIPIFAQSKLDLSELGESGDTFLQTVVKKMQEEIQTLYASTAAQIEALDKEDSSFEQRRSRLEIQSIDRRTNIERYYVSTIHNLARAGANIDQQNASGDTLLHFSVEKYLPLVTHMLVEVLDAKVNIENQDGMTPLHIASGNKLTSYTVRMDTLPGIPSLSPHLLPSLQSETIVSSRVSDIETVKLLVVHGADVNGAGGISVSQKKPAPIFYAIISDNCDVVEFLIQSGANEVPWHSHYPADFSDSDKMTKTLTDAGFVRHGEGDIGILRLLLRTLEGEPMSNEFEEGLLGEEESED